MTMPDASPAENRLTSLLHSIRFRLVLWFTAVLALVLLVFCTFIFLNQRHDILGESEYRLDRKMAALSVTLTITPDGLLIPPGVLQDTDVLLFTGPTGQVLVSYGPLGDLEARRTAYRALSEYRSISASNRIVSWMERIGIRRTRYLFVTVPLGGGSAGGGLVVLGGPADPYGLGSRLFLTLSLGSLATLIIALLGGYWLADRAMRPVRTITQAARNISETDLSRRLNMNSKDELGELADTFDAMLERLQAAFNRQRQFVADASHELRTPLTIVNLETSRTLASRQKPEEYQHALAVIQSENDFMTRLVGDLLTLARMDAGQAVLQHQSVDLSDVVVEMMERLDPLAARNGVGLIAGNLPEACILGDRQYLIQMVSNLVENGIKYASGDESRVILETGTSAGTVWLRVSDNGPGIAPEHLPHIFDRFYRVDPSRSREPDSAQGGKSLGGSGLGLSIVQWIARSHGGDVRVESQVGVGTTFEVRFRTL